MATGEGVAGADLNVNPAGLQSLSEEMSNAQSAFEAAIESIDTEVMNIAGNAMGADSVDYQAFVQKYQSEMKPLAEEISETLESHASKAATTASNAGDTIAANLKVIG